MRRKKYIMIAGVIIILIAVFYRDIFRFLGIISNGTTAQLTYRNLLYSRFLFWGIAIFLFFYAHFAEKQDLLLKKPERRRIGFYFLSVVCIYGAILLSGILLMLILKSLGYSMNQQGDYLKNMAGILRAHPVLLLFTCATAGITEEIIFRGYLQQRIELILKSPVAGIVISSVIFGLAHSFYGTIQQVAIPFAIGIIFSIYYFKYKNIYVLMVFHFLFDYIQLLFLHIK